MFVSETGVALISIFEGLKLVGYLDAVKVPTIGYGHTENAGGEINYTDGTVSTKVFVGKSITKEEAKRLLARDLLSFEKAVLSKLKHSPTQFQFDAMVSLAFNVGPAAFARSSILRFFNSKNYVKAADAFLLWNKAGGKILNGLVRRRNAERELFLGDVARASFFVKEALPNYGAPLVKPPEKVEETKTKPDDTQGTKATQSTTIWAQLAAIITTIGTAAAQALGSLDWKTAAVITFGGVAAFGIYTILERMRHAKENGV